jgi:hypothetical protein
MTTASPDPAFYERIEAIQGWLNPAAGQRTRDILAWQGANGITGNLMEIGVFCGKYFSCLVESARATGMKVLGIDTFQFAPQERVVSELTKLFGPDIAANYTLWQRFSTAVRPWEILQAIGAPRFISIDGAHDYENVYRDLVLCDEIVARNGLIAVDDFLNPLTLGVNQAVNHFLMQPRSVVPVAYVSNKLFLAHCSRADLYRQAFEEAILAGSEPQSVHFRSMVKVSRSHVEQPFFGHMVLLS